MRTARLLVLLATLLTLVVGAGTARSADNTPTGLHGFLLRADEPQKTSFSRTPSFAWSPVPGALHYEFQLSLSDAFRDNSIIFADANAATPVEAPALTLPWITGSPHALYARVRAITPDGATPWSTNFGFDMVPPTPPTPLSSYPGILRWTPVEGAYGYQIWFIDAHKMVRSVTNTLDEREFYTFHQTANWTGAVRWRIRALRIDLTIGAATRLNSIPATQYGPWSPIYTSTNPPVTGGPITLVGTVSDVFSNGSSTSPSHRLMPGFLWTGNKGIDGTTAELYRVYIFTDKQCINRVYTGAVVGSTAYAPRPFGPLALPTTSGGVSSARSTYLLDGSEPPSYTYDGESVTTSEAVPSAAPTTAIPNSPGDSTSSSSPSPSSPSPSSSSSSSPAPASGSSSFTFNGNPGAPIDLWDTSWPESGYYWTVVAVSASSPNALYTSVGPGGAKGGDTSLPLANAAGFNVGDAITVGTGATAESGTIVGINGNSVTLAAAFKFGHGGGELVVRSGGSLVYHDLELAQDVCAAGRVMRFGKESEPSLVSAGQLFATGLSDQGRLTSAVQTTSFYGEPLVSWTPALGAEAYEVQWSKTQYPFNPVTLAAGGTGVMTGATSIVFPKDLGPGTWYYRVRGFDYSLPTGAQQMSWSDPAKLVVAPPKFSIVGTKPPAKTKAAVKSSTTSGLQTLAGSGFTMGVPTTWTHLSIPDSVATFVYRNPTTLTNLVEVTASGRGTRSLAQWAADLKLELASATGAVPSTSLVTLAAGKAVKLTVTRTSKGQTISQVQYVVDGGATAYSFTFTTTAARLAADAPTFAKMIASLRLTA